MGFPSASSSNSIVRRACLTHYPFRSTAEFCKQVCPSVRFHPGGRFCFPKWLNDNFYIELTVEVKDPVKGWLNPRNYRNESWDLLVYCVAATLTPAIGLEYMDPSNPPSWAEE